MPAIRHQARRKYGLDVNLDYRKNFDKVGRELGISAQYSGSQDNTDYHFTRLTEADLETRKEQSLNIGKNNEISMQIKEAKKPTIIIGESLLNSNSSKYLFNKIKEFLTENNKITDDWNSLNILSCDASTVGNFDLGLVNENKSLLEDLQNHKFEIIYLVGQDNLNFDKKDEFIIYQGSHGDKGAEIADIILPGSAYTEQDGYFTNLEGKIQKAYKASYPPGDAKEDWQIINELAELMNNRKLFNDKDELESSMLNYLNLEKEKQINEDDENTKLDENEFKSETLNIVVKDYYFSNVIARSSKTMVECNNSKLNLKSTGTEG